MVDGSQQTDYRVAINLDEQMLRKVPGYNRIQWQPAQHATVWCAMHKHNRPGFCGWKAISRMGKNNGFLLELKQWASRGGSGSPGEQSHSDRKAVGGPMTYSN